MRRRRRAPRSMQVNLIPLVDVTFLLIVFFVMVARITGADLPPLKLAEPQPSALKDPGAPQRVVVNVSPEGSGDAAYSVDFQKFNADGPGIAGLRSALRAALKQNPEVNIDIRADRAATFGRVRPVLESAVGAAADLKLPQAQLRLVARATTGIAEGAP